MEIQPKSIVEVYALIEDNFPDNESNFISAARAREVTKRMADSMFLAGSPLVKGLGFNTPPLAVGTGDAYIVGTDPTGDWVGHPKKIAIKTEDGWAFITPVDNTRVLLVGVDNYIYMYLGIYPIGIWTSKMLLASGGNIQVEEITITNTQETDGYVTLSHPLTQVVLFSLDGSIQPSALLSPNTPTVQDVTYAGFTEGQTLLIIYK